MTLYEINKKVLDAIEFGCDPETGEVIDAVQLDALQMAFTEKTENICLYIKDLTAEAEALAKEAQALQRRRQAAENKAGWLKRYVQGTLNGEKFKTPKCSISYRKSQGVVITDESAIPLHFLKVETSPMKAEIKEALKRGEQVGGAVLEDRVNMILK